MIRKIELCGRKIEYDLQRKKVKNINLRIKSDGKIYVSASDRVTLKSIEDFMRANGSYIVKTLERFDAIEQRAAKPLEFVDGERVSVLGCSVPIRIIEGNRNFAELTERGVVITVKDTADVDSKKKALENLLCGICRTAVTDVCKRVCEVLKPLGVDEPIIKFRKMHTKWGICRPTRKEITFSYMLASAPLDCIEYVAYHEFSHFLHPDHSKAFYACLSRFVPDWKEKKERLNSVASLK